MKNLSGKSWKEKSFWVSLSNGEHMVRNFFVIFNFFLLNFFVPENTKTQEMNLIAVGKANVQKTTIAFGYDNENKMKASQANMRDEFLAVMNNDFGFYRQFFSVQVSEKNNAFPFNSPDFNLLGLENILYFGQISFSYQRGMKYNFSLFNVRDEKTILSREGSFNSGNLRKEGHNLADQVYRALTKKESIFKSQIIFVSDRGSTKKRRVKELYTMDFDGENKKRLTRHRAIVMSPAISPDKTKILYSLIRWRGNKRNVNLYVLDRTTGKNSLLSNRRGINSGAVFTPDGKHILLTLSFVGNAEIYKMNLETKALSRLTRSLALDVDPSVKNDGTLMAFLSSRSGAAHVYTMNPAGMERQVDRISFVGKFNATPRFSPDGKEIAFSSWIDPRFDIVRIGSDGKNLVRLTKDFGSNEDPTYSNDGQFIAFSSQRVLSRTKAIHNIYAMTRDGEIIGTLTKRFGNCTTPRWSR